LLRRHSLVLGTLATLAFVGPADAQRATRRGGRPPVDVSGTTAATPARTATVAPSTPPLPLDAEQRARARYVTPDLLDATPVPDDYVLGAGDILAFVLVVADTRTEQLPVLPEGVVVVPNVGPVPAAGRTLAEFRAALQKAVSQRYRDFELYCYLARPRQFRVWVSGEVREPGAVAARALERVSDVVDRAGGLTDRASRREIELCDADGTVRARVDLDAFFLRGDVRGDPAIGGAQMIRVPAQRHSVEITGEVASPGTYEPRSGETLPELLALAGGLLPTANRARVSVEYTDIGGAVRVQTFDLAHDAPDTQDATRVTVLSNQLGRPRVFVTGPQGTAEPVFLAPGETLAGLVRRTATLGPDADLGGARLATRDSLGKALLIPVDLTRVLAGEQDRPLHDGDALTVPPVKSYVYVSGFVTRPGRFPYHADWTVNDYVGEAGGPTSAGSLKKASILAGDGRRRGADRRSTVQRGETVFIDRTFTFKAATALALLANFSALIISVVALKNK